MRSKSAITKLQTILIIDLIIVAAAIGGALYVHSTIPPAAPQPKPVPPAQIELTNLQIAPAQSEAGQLVNVSVNATNLGAQAGSYQANLTLDGSFYQNQTIQLSSSESTTIQFALNGTAVGNHVVVIGNLTGSFLVNPPPTPAEFQLTNLAINRTVAGIGEAIGVSVNAANTGDNAGDYNVTLLVNNSVVSNQQIHLAGGNVTTVQFALVETATGTYNVQIGNLTGTFTIKSAAPPPKPAAFQVSVPTITPQTVAPGEVVDIAVTVTNTGEESGVLTLNLTINDILSDAKTVQLSGGSTQIVDFNVSEAVTGTYTVSVAGLSGTFAVQKPANLALSNLYINPEEAWTGYSIAITANAFNNGAAGNATLTLTIDGQPQASQNFYLNAGGAGTISFTVTAGATGTHTVTLGSLTGTLNVVQNGYHTLHVIGQSGEPVKFTIDGKDATTPYAQLLPVGQHALTVPPADPTGKYTFTNWDDGSTNPTRTITLTTEVFLVAYYSGGQGSCPSLYTWNGTSYAYQGDISNHGWLGYINYLDQNGNVVFWRNNPWDYVPVDKTQTQIDNNGNINMTIAQNSDEIFYLDTAYMMVVDHPTNTNVYSTMIEQYLDPNYMGQIYSVNTQNLTTPVSAVNQNGDNVLPQISKMDDAFTNGTSGILSPAWNNVTWNTLTLDLGNLTGAKQIKLVVRAIVDWGNGTDYGNWLNKFFAQPVPNGTQPTPQSYMEVKDANGNWIPVPESRQMPLPADRVPRTFVVDLTGLFPTNNYQLRINSFWNVTYDYIGVDTSQQAPITIQKVNAQGTLVQQSFTNSVSSGNFTRYGNVTQLLLNEDDEYVIGRQGDAVLLSFNVANLKPVAPGTTRDYFLFEASWFKDKNGNWGYGFPFMVDPLPFQSMSSFPYPLDTEHYPNDTAHLNYIQEYNTRTINITATATNTIGTNSSFNYVLDALPLILAGSISTAIAVTSSKLSSLTNNSRKQRKNQLATENNRLS
jgi:hypothetical protein